MSREIYFGFSDGALGRVRVSAFCMGWSIMKYEIYEMNDSGHGTPVLVCERITFHSRAYGSPKL